VTQRVRHHRERKRRGERQYTVVAREKDLRGLLTEAGMLPAHADDSAVRAAAQRMIDTILQESPR
jgi:hypothetical protein